MTPHPFSIKLDQTSVVPLNEQLTKALQEEIRHRLQPGDRLPASRILAECLGISRNTVTAAYKRLVDEGWCDARVGSGTCVAEHLPLRERRDPRTVIDVRTLDLNRECATRQRRTKGESQRREGNEFSFRHRFSPSWRLGTWREEK